MTREHPSPEELVLTQKLDATTDPDMRALLDAFDSVCADSEFWRMLNANRARQVNRLTVERDALQATIVKCEADIAECAGICEDLRSTVRSIKGIL